MDDSASAIIRANLDRIYERIERGCARASRPPDSVSLVAVTKTVSVEVIQRLYELGERQLGENRPQSLWEKAPQLPGDIAWHLIGHLQTNKVRKSISMVSLIHSVDSFKLAETISQESLRIGRTTPILLEVNMSLEENKHGFTEADVRKEYVEIATLPGCKVCGLMTMARFEEDPQNCRPTFAALRQLRDDLKKASNPLTVLSMGMSNDFEIAIEEGATHIRVGTAIFEGLPRS